MTLPQKTLPVNQTLTQLERSGVQTMRVWPARVSWSLGNFIISVVNVRAGDSLTYPNSLPETGSKVK